VSLLSMHCGEEVQDSLHGAIRGSSTTSFVSVSAKIVRNCGPIGEPSGVNWPSLFDVEKVILSAPLATFCPMGILCAPKRLPMNCDTPLYDCQQILRSK
jgi:hypothetical protein